MGINEEVDVFLEHHGVKGMHWGITHITYTQRVVRKIIKKNKKININHPSISSGKKAFFQIGGKETDFPIGEITHR